MSQKINCLNSDIYVYDLFVAALFAAAVKVGTNSKTDRFYFYWLNLARNCHKRHASHKNFNSQFAELNRNIVNVLVYKAPVLVTMPRSHTYRSKVCLRAAPSKAAPSTLGTPPINWYLLGTYSKPTKMLNDMVNQFTQRPEDLGLGGIDQWEIWWVSLSRVRT